MKPKDIKSIRKEMGLTQSQLAEKLGVSERTIRRWENGESTPPLSAKLFLKILYLEKTPIDTTEF